MSTSLDITLYQVAFTESQNFFFDDEPPYAETIAQWTGLTPFAIALETSVKVSLLAKEEYRQKPNYCKCYVRDTLFPSQGRTYFYYVTNVKRRSNQVLELSLKMDVLNTFRDKIIGNFSGRTIINRQHVNRFDLSGYTTSYGSHEFKISVDKISEGINPKLYLKSKQLISKSTFGNFGNFYLIYKTSSELSEENLNNPVSCYLVADNTIPADEAVSSVITWYGDNMPQEGWYLCASPELKITIGTPRLTETYGYDQSGSKCQCQQILLHWDGSTMEIYAFKKAEAASLITQDFWFPTMDSQPTEYFDFDGTASSYVTFTFAPYLYYLSSGTSSLTKAVNTGTLFLRSGVSAQKRSIPFSSVNRTDSKTMKIIKLPYSPMDISRVDSHYEIEGFTFDETLNMFKLNDISTSFGVPISNITDISQYFIKTLDIETGLYSAARYLEDPKLYNSDFFSYKFNYDNFSIQIPLENCYPTSSSANQNLTIYFKPTNTINSKFLFALIPDNFQWDKIGDYESFLVVSRNNEVTLFNNDYLNYLRTGYNYDKKTKAVQDTASVISAGLATAGGVAAIAGGVASGNYAVALGGASAIAGSWTSTISNAVQRENSFASKIASLQARASSVSGVDDMDLFDYYGDNALTLTTWATNDVIKKYLDDLFYYFGYARNAAGVPDLTSRIHFNYLQCDAVFDNPQIFEDYLDEIKTKLSNGVTYFHIHDGSYDLTQSLENFEKGLFPAE